MKSHAIQKITLLTFATLALNGCTHDQPSVIRSSENESQSSTEEKSSIKGTGEFLIQNHHSDYQIVIPDNSDSNTSFAATELQTFLLRATDCKLEIVSDVGLTYDEGAHYLALGKTTIWDGSGFTIPENLMETGYRMERAGKQILLNAKNSTGVITGVYDFLEQEVGLEIYSYDEIAIDTVADVELLDWSVFKKPVFDMRKILYNTLLNNQLYKRRMRLYSDQGGGEWAAFTHTTVSTFLPYDVYGKDHPDWYASGGSQVCYSNAAMQDEMVERMKYFIEKNPDAYMIQIGHEDNVSMCECADCVAARKRLGGYSGQELDYTNQVADRLDEWLASAHPERTMKYVFFAYQTSQNPPLKTKTSSDGTVSYVTDANGNYVPFSDDFRIQKNVMVMYCPIDMDFSVPMSHPSNAAQYQQIKGWCNLYQSVGLPGGVYVWDYSIASSSLMVPLNNFGSSEVIYDEQAKLGVTAVMDQADHQTGTPAFESLKIYTESKAMYESDIHYNDLCDGFIAHYYGEAAPYLSDYFYLLRSYYQEKGFSGHIFDDFYQKSLWSFDILQKFSMLIEKGIEAIEPLKNSDHSRYLTLYDRLRREECFPIFVTLRLFMDQLTTQQQKDDWQILNEYTKKYNMAASREGSFDMANLLEAMRLEIYGE